jgi:hypothetical protein
MFLDNRDMENTPMYLGTRTPYIQKESVIWKKIKKIQTFFGTKGDQLLYSYKKDLPGNHFYSFWVKERLRHAIY